MGIFPPCSSTEMLGKLLETVCGKNRDTPIEIENGERPKIKGTVVLMKKNILDVKDVGASILDRLHELFHRGVSIQLVSADQIDPGNLDSVIFLSLTSLLIGLVLQLYEEKRIPFVLSPFVLQQNTTADYA